MKAIYTLVGMKHRGTEALVKSLPDSEDLNLIREPGNPHDPNAVQVWARGQHVAFIKGTEVRSLAAWMDADPTRKQYGVVGTFRAPFYWPMVEVEQ